MVEHIKLNNCCNKRNMIPIAETGLNCFLIAAAKIQQQTGADFMILLSFAEQNKLEQFL